MARSIVSAVYDFVGAISILPFVKNEDGTRDFGPDVADDDIVATISGTIMKNGSAVGGPINIPAWKMRDASASVTPDAKNPNHFVVSVPEKKAGRNEKVHVTSDEVRNLLANF